MKVELNYNNEKKGIELLFSEPLAKGASTRLRKLGFKRGFKSKSKWYAPQHPAFVTYAEHLKQVLLKSKVPSDAKDILKNIPIRASFTPSTSNVENYKFSYVIIYFKPLGDHSEQQGEQGRAQETYIIFDTYKTVATAIATSFGVAKYKDQFRGVKVFPRNHKLKARVLLQEGKVITDSHYQSGQLSPEEQNVESDFLPKEKDAKSDFLSKEQNGEPDFLPKEKDGKSA